VSQKANQERERRERQRVIAIGGPIGGGGLHAAVVSPCFIFSFYCLFCSFSCFLVLDMFVFVLVMSSFFFIVGGERKKKGI
jgi:hypothetical protein